MQTATKKETPIKHSFKKDDSSIFCLQVFDIVHNYKTVAYFAFHAKITATSVYHYLIS